MTLRCDIPASPHGAPPGAALGRAATWVVSMIIAGGLLANVMQTVLTPLPVAALLPPPPPVIAKTPPVESRA